MSKKIAGRVFLAIFVSYFLILVLITLAGNKLSIDVGPLMIISEGIIVLPALIAYLCISKQVSFAEAFRFRKIRPLTILAIIGYGLLIMPLGTLMNSISMLLVDNVFVQSSGELLALKFPMAFVILAVYGPLCEELAFRGIIQSSLDYEKYGWKTVVLVGLTFGLMHMNLNQFMYACALGITFALLVEATNSVWSSIICHTLFNGLNVLNMFLYDKFMPGFYESEAVQDAMNRDQLIMAVGVYAIVAAITTTLAMFLLKWISEREGNSEFFSRLKGTKNRILTPIMVLTIILYVGYIGTETYLQLK